MTKQIGEAAKTVIIVLLLAGALLLAGKTGIFSEVFQSVPLLAKAGEWISGFGKPDETLDLPPVGGVDLTQAAKPVDIVVTGQEGKHYGVKYDGDALSRLYDQFANILGEALGSASTPEEITESRWRSALKARGIYFDFLSELPLSALVRWLGLEMLNPNDHAARRICLAEDKDGGIELFYMSDKGRFYQCDTAAALGSISSQLDGYMPNGAQYAYDLGDRLAELDPYTLLLTNSPEKMRIKVETLLYASTSLETILPAFGINPYSTDRYTESDGTVVYVETSGRLMISERGLIAYKAGDEEVEAMKIEYAGQAPDTGELIEGARELVMSLYEGSPGDEDIFFSGMSEDAEGGHRITFNYFINGVQILLPNESAATVTIRDGFITGARINLKGYRLTDEEVELPPELQEAAIVQFLSPGSELRLVYSDVGGESIEPIWVAG